ncbi:MAG TPA: transglutaminase domain-containing protein [Puia sp.]|jgi:hypothetical protein|nr:transglutaminase domain-containing protein [Puia sp.]
MKWLTFLPTLLLASLIHAQKPVGIPNPYASIDAHSLLWPDSVTGSVEGLARYVNDHFQTQTEKARAIFVWITGNIRYDIDNMFAINFYEDPAEKIAKPLRTRKGICENYAALFAAVCKKSGIHAVVIEGYTKQRGFTDYIPHAWCGADIDGKWWLFDPTWGSGYVAQGKFVQKLNETYFKASPEVFIRDHMPFDYLWEFLYYPITNQEFYEGKTAEDKSKSYFSFPDSIRVYEGLSSVEQESAAALRVEKNGLRNGMIFDWLRHLKNDLENDRINRVIDTYNSAVADYNNALKLFNVFINYRNEQFKPIKPDAEIQQMLDTVAHLIDIARAKEAGLQLTPADTRVKQGITQLNGNLDDFVAHVKEQQDWLKTYFSKSKMGRKNMFYKVTLFGKPIN